MNSSDATAADHEPAGDRPRRDILRPFRIPLFAAAEPLFPLGALRE